MTTQWRLFIGACILVAGLLIKLGAPLVPVLAGLTLAGLFTWRSRTKQK